MVCMLNASGHSGTGTLLVLFGDVIRRSSTVGGSMSRETLRVQSLALLLLSFLLSVLYIFFFSELFLFSIIRIEPRAS